MTQEPRETAAQQPSKAETLAKLKTYAEQQAQEAANRLKETTDLRLSLADALAEVARMQRLHKQLIHAAANQAQVLAEKEEEIKTMQNTINRLTERYVSEHDQSHCANRRAGRNNHRRKDARGSNSQDK